MKKKNKKKQKFKKKWPLQWLKAPTATPLDTSTRAHPLGFFSHSICTPVYNEYKYTYVLDVSYACACVYEGENFSTQTQKYSEGIKKKKKWRDKLTALL